jgi:enterochelin esterase-like enzyme
MVLRSIIAGLGRLVMISIIVTVLLPACSAQKDSSSPKAVAPQSDARDGENSLASSGSEETGDRGNVPEKSSVGLPSVVKQSEQIQPSATERSKKNVVASLPRSAAPVEPTVKKISGYKTPAEYFLVQSRNYPEAAAVVMLPKDYEQNSNKSYPLVVAFGGAGECARPPRAGSLAWMHYYKTDETVDALSDNTLVKEDFRGLVAPAHLREFNERLEKNPYDGIILVCPYSPPLSFTEGLEFPWYEAYIMEDLIPALKKRYRVARGKLGVDGVSMGGTRSLYYGFKYPDVFSSIGAVQGAVGGHLPLYRKLIARNKDILKNRSIQLVTSDKDYLAGSVKKMHRLLREENIPHAYYMLTGPHDYIFNQGPGSVALLVFHNESLNGKPVGPVK